MVFCVLLSDTFDQIGWKETNIIENWHKNKDKNGRAVKALGHIF